jgi:hypothetical protein
MCTGHYYWSSVLSQELSERKEGEEGSKGKVKLWAMGLCHEDVLDSGGVGPPSSTSALGGSEWWVNFMAQTLGLLG